jgi:hypothetical protein
LCTKFVGTNLSYFVGVVVLKKKRFKEDVEANVYA